MKKKKLPLWGALALIALYLLFGLGPKVPEAAEPAPPTEALVQTTEALVQSTEALVQSTAEAELPDPESTFTSKEDVALYIHTYGHLPPNFITKAQARELGWEGGGLEIYAPGKCIGGDRFGNYEGLLPDAPGRSWTKCDIDTLGSSSRGAKRIVFSNDGLIYYTEDHYASFELLYGEP